MLKHRSRPLLVVLAYLSFVSIGVPDGLLGVAWPSVRAFFGLSLDALGALLVMYTAGYLVSSFGSGRAMARMNVGSLLALSCLGTAASLLGYALAPQWWAMVALGLVSGLGAGAIDAGLNTYAATRFSMREVNWLHAFYGVGATLGPLIMTGVIISGRPWQWGYAIVGASQLVLAVCFGLTRASWSPAGAAGDVSGSTPAGAAPGRSSLRRPVVWLSMAVFFVYAGVEAIAGAWSYSLFTEARAVPAATAGMWVSVYWACLTAGRIASGIAASFVPVSRLVRTSIVGAALGAALIWLDIAGALNFLGLALIGLSAAPIFPSLIATTPNRVDGAHVANAIGFQIGAAVLGQSLLPGAVGVLASVFGLEIIGPALLTAALVLLGLYGALTTMSCNGVPKATAVSS